MKKEELYNKLYILHNNHQYWKHSYWTQIGNDYDKSITYRSEQRELRNFKRYNEIYTMEFETAEECKRMQLTVNEVFKIWTANSEQMAIWIGVDTLLFTKILDYIKSNIDNTDVLETLMINLYNKYEAPKGYGTVYLVKCINDKLKIGESNDFKHRWPQLQEEKQNQAIEIIDTFNTSNRYYDEAILQLKCRKYKADGNKERTNCHQSKYLSELFNNCQEVIDIWNKYKEGK